MNGFKLLSRSAAETCDLGLKLARTLEQSTFIALRGELGGGKTCFTRGVVSGIAPESVFLVSSPSYAIINEYPGNPSVYHFDFYRLTSEHEIAELGFEEYFNGSGICIAEWPERLGTLLPQERIDIIFEHEGDDCRRISFNATGPRHRALLVRFRQNLGTSP